MGALGDRPLCLPLLLSAFIMVAAPLRAVRSQQPAPLARAERVLDSLLADGAPGAAVVIVHDGRVVLNRGFGTGNIETGAPVTPDMVFRVAVACQPLLALILLSMAEQGKFDLHAPIGRYVRGLSPKLAMVTTHQLLTGTSGARASGCDGGKSSWRFCSRAAGDRANSRADPAVCRQRSDDQLHLDVARRRAATL